METDKKVKIVIATHKKYEMPDDLMYLPLHVGAEGTITDLGYSKDNTGNNISLKNAGYCELTGLYWAWKNLREDYIGIVHYRRYFGRRSRHLYDRVLSYEELKPELGKIKVFVPRKRKYYIETLYSHYSHTHYAEHLDLTRKIILKKYPEYLDSYDTVIRHRYGYMFNMMIMEREWLDKYCTWLFDILFELERWVDQGELSDYQGRFYGRVSEIIFNVWLDKQIKIGALSADEIKVLPCFYAEKINWGKKGMAFLKAKLFNKKYEGSF